MSNISAPIVVLKDNVSFIYVIATTQCLMCVVSHPSRSRSLSTIQYFNSFRTSPRRLSAFLDSWADARISLSISIKVVVTATRPPVLGSGIGVSSMPEYYGNSRITGIGSLEHPEPPKSFIRPFITQGPWNFDMLVHRGHFSLQLLREVYYNASWSGLRLLAFSETPPPHRITFS